MIVRRPPCNVVDDCDTPARYVQPSPSGDRYACAYHLLRRVIEGKTAIKEPT